MMDNVVPQLLAILVVGIIWAIVVPWSMVKEMEREEWDCIGGV